MKSLKVLLVAALAIGLFMASPAAQASPRGFGGPRIGHVAGPRVFAPRIVAPRVGYVGGPAYGYGVPGYTAYGWGPGYGRGWVGRGPVRGGGFRGGARGGRR